MLYAVAFIAGVTAMAIVNHYEHAFLVKELATAEAKLKSLSLAVRKKV